MKSISTTPSISLHSLTTPKSTPSRLVAPNHLTVRCVYKFDSPNPTIKPTRADWQSSCAILASKVNSHDTIDKRKIDNNSLLLPEPFSMTTTDLSPVPKHGSRLRVAYQGVPGAYSEAATGMAYPGCEPVPCDQFDVAFQSVELWLADRAVMPVENSLGGSIHRNYDLLLRHRLHIVGEVLLLVHHCLLALPGVKTEHLTRVISHPQALAQCERTLDGLLAQTVPATRREAVCDTAGAAEMVAVGGLRDTAAVASHRAAELYGMTVLADGIQDDAGNVTRFVVLAREPIVPTTDRPFKTSIVFRHHDDERKSFLFKVLVAFAFREISLTKIESRPYRNKSETTTKHFEYMFYVDFEGSMAEVRVQNALAEVQEYTSFLRVLGSYPMDMTPCSRKH